MGFQKNKYRICILNVHRSKMTTCRKNAVSKPYLNIFEHSFFPLVVRYHVYVSKKNQIETLKG